MEDEIKTTADQWFDSTFLVLNESYQPDLRRFLSADAYELIHILSDYYMYDYTGLFIHLLGLTSHYLTSSSFVYADNQLRHKLNLHLLLIVREGYERSSVVEHIKQAMNNVQSLRQTGKQLDIHHRFNSNIFCQSDDMTQSTFGFCISDKFDEHGTHTHIQRQQTSSIIGTSNGHFIRQSLETKFHKKNNTLNHNADWLMMFLTSKPRLFCRRLKVFDLNRYPSLEHWVIVINCLCSNSIDFYFDQTQANQFMCDYLDTLSLKATSLEDTQPWMASRYLSAREHVLRVSTSLRVIEMAVEMLIIYRKTFHTFGQADKIFVDNIIRLIEQTKNISTIRRIYINSVIVQSAIYFVDISLKQFEIMFEPTLNHGTPHHDHSSFPNQPSANDCPCLIPASSSLPVRSNSPPSKRIKSMIDPSYVKSLELAHELLLLPYVAFTRTSVYANSKIKRYAAYLDFVIEELKKFQLIITVRQGVQMIDGTRRRVDLLIKCPPILKQDENHRNEAYDKDLMERLKRFGVDYEHYIQTLGTLDIGEKYRLSDQCFDLLNSTDYKRYLTIDLERLAPLHRIQREVEDEQGDEEEEEEEGTGDSWKSSNQVKIEPANFYV